MISLNPQTFLGEDKPENVFGAGTDAFLALLRLVTDPDASKKRMSDIFDACVNANEVISSAKEAQAQLEVDHAKLKAERDAHDRSLAAERAKQDAESKAVMDDVRARLASAAKLEASAKADADAAANLKAELENRLEKIKAAAT